MHMHIRIHCTQNCEIYKCTLLSVSVTYRIAGISGLRIYISVLLFAKSRCCAPPITCTCNLKGN